MISRATRLATRLRDAGPLTKQTLSIYLKALDAIDAALDSGDGGVLIVSEDEDGTEAGATAIVIAWLLARRAVPWAEVQAAVEPEPGPRPRARAVSYTHLTLPTNLRV